MSLRLYVLPISGGAFPVQLGLLSKLFDGFKKIKNKLSGGIDYYPDLILGASGGNVASYLAMGGDWYYEGICRMSENVNRQMFVKSWWPDDLDFIPTWALTIFTGSIYRTGYGPENLLTVAFPGKKIKQVEILTLAFNSSDCHPQIFSNKSQEESMIPFISDTDKYLFNLMDIKYLDGNIPEIAKACMASAAIPIVTQPQTINGDKFDDGGLSAASPLSLLPVEIYDLVKKDDKLLQLFYFAPYNMDDEKNEYFVNSEGVIRTINFMVHSRTLQDRANAVQLLEKVLCGKSVREDFVNANDDILSQQIEKYSLEHYVLILYPPGAPEIDITTFEENDIIDLINKTRKDFNFSIWHKE